MTPWSRCSFVADAEGDPRAATAPPAEQWFLLEHPGPWGRAGYAEAALAPAAVAALTTWARSCGGRVLLIRRPGRTPAPVARRWFRIDSRCGQESIRAGLVAGDSDIEIATRGPGQPHPGPVVLVCAHGRHDTCCSVRGRPVAAGLAATYPDQVWESSHIGGCRFAPAMVLLPHGFVFGGLDPDTAVTTVAAYRAGTVEPDLLRGRSSLAAATQAAQHIARQQTGATGVDALRPVDVTADGPRWQVRMTGPDCTVTLIERRIATGRPLTCAATTPGWMRTFDLTSFDTG